VPQPGDPRMARSSLDHKHGRLYSSGAEPVQGFLAGLSGSRNAIADNRKPGERPPAPWSNNGRTTRSHMWGATPVHPGLRTRPKVGPTNCEKNISPLHTALK